MNYCSFFFESCITFDEWFSLYLIRKKRRDERDLLSISCILELSLRKIVKKYLVQLVKRVKLFFWKTQCAFHFVTTISGNFQCHPLQHCFFSYESRKHGMKNWKIVKHKKGWATLQQRDIVPSNWKNIFVKISTSFSGRFHT